jgi:hypothetical protein
LPGEVRRRGASNDGLQIGIRDPGDRRRHLGRQLRTILGMRNRARDAPLGGPLDRGQGRHVKA